VYANNPKTLEDLKENIRTEIRRIDTAELHRVYDNMLQRAQKCVDVQGDHFQHILYRVSTCICICLISCTESETYAHVGLRDGGPVFRASFYTLDHGSPTTGPQGCIYDPRSHL
jgi:hypothetical protein